MSFKKNLYNCNILYNCNRGLEFRCDLSKSPDDNLGPIENTDGSEDLIIFYESVRKIRKFLSDKEFLLKNRKVFGYSKFYHFTLLDHSLEQLLGNDDFESLDLCWRDPKYSYDDYINHKKPSWRMTLGHCNASYLRSQICLEFLGDNIKLNQDINKNIDNDIYNVILIIFTMIVTDDSDPYLNFNKEEKANEQEEKANEQEEEEKANEQEGKNKEEG